MPIYAYRCEQCGAEKDVLQKIADAPLVDCPACGAPRFRRLVTAAAFQLKGSGWYVTDFREGNKGKKPGDGKSGGDEAKPAGGKDTAAPAPTPAVSSGSSEASGSSGSSSGTGSTGGTTGGEAKSTGATGGTPSGSTPRSST